MTRRVAWLPCLTGQIIFSSSPQEHYFDCPYQLSSEAVGQTYLDAMVWDFSNPYRIICTGLSFLSSTVSSCTFLPKCYPNLIAPLHDFTSACNPSVHIFLIHIRIMCNSYLFCRLPSPLWLQWYPKLIVSETLTWLVTVLAIPVWNSELYFKANKEWCKLGPRQDHVLKSWKYSV